MISIACSSEVTAVPRFQPRSLEVRSSMIISDQIALLYPQLELLE
jgi:hypothetical protein